MQQEVLASLALVVADDDDIEPPVVENFGFNLPVGYVLETAQIFIASNYATMPNAGGWNDQDQRWCDDMLTVMRLRNRLRWEKKNGYTGKQPAQETDDEETATRDFFSRM